jgi:peptidoglycan/LPS O-acetylase OafA/YrhL
MTAVLLVVFYHFFVHFSFIPFWNAVILNGGQLGVNIFYAISGLLISYPFVKNSLQENPKPNSIRHYIFNRCFRILPLFWIVTLTVFIFKDHIRLYHLAPFDISIKDLMLYLFFLSDKLDPLNPVVWTLRIEVLFYILFPVLFALSKPRHKQFSKFAYPIFAIIVLSFFAYRFNYVRLYGPLLYSNLISNLELFFLGVTASFVLLNDNKKLFKLPFPIVLPIIVLLILLKLNETVYANVDVYFPFFRSLSNICIFLLLIGMMRGNVSSRYQTIVKPVTFISLISYSLYLLHFNIYYSVALPVLQRAFHSENVNLFAWEILALIIAITLSYITYRLIERPFLSFKNKLFAK